MASRLWRCRRCRQAVLSDARCCPHCAIPRPAARSLVRGLVLSAAAVAVIGSGLRVASERTGEARTWSVPSLWGGVTALFDDPAAAACQRRGGTLVRVPGAWLGAVRRCASGFVDEGMP